MALLRNLLPEAVLAAEALMLSARHGISMRHAWRLLQGAHAIALLAA